METAEAGGMCHFSGYLAQKCKKNSECKKCKEMLSTDSESPKVTIDIDV